MESLHQKGGQGKEEEGEGCQTKVCNINKRDPMTSTFFSSQGKGNTADEFLDIRSR
jgi:hypothetical protein